MDINLWGRQPSAMSVHTDVNAPPEESGVFRPVVTWQKAKERKGKLFISGQQ
jgi:hypothetical protein